MEAKGPAEALRQLKPAVAPTGPAYAVLLMVRDLARVVVLRPRPVVLTEPPPVADTRQIGQGDGAARPGVQAGSPAAIPPSLPPEKAPEAAVVAEMARKTGRVTRVA